MRLEQDGYDLLEGVGMDRSAAQNQQKAIVYASSSVHPCVHESDVLTLVVDTNFVASAQIAIDVYYALG